MTIFRNRSPTQTTARSSWHRADQSGDSEDWIRPRIEILNYGGHERIYSKFDAVIYAIAGSNYAN